jgi:hypothetical protein
MALQAPRVDASATGAITHLRSPELALKELNETANPPKSWRICRSVVRLGITASPRLPSWSSVLSTARADALGRPYLIHLHCAKANIITPSSTRPARTRKSILRGCACPRRVNALRACVHMCVSLRRRDGVVESTQKQKICNCTVNSSACRARAAQCVYTPIRRKSSWLLDCTTADVTPMAFYAGPAWSWRSPLWRPRPSRLRDVQLYGIFDTS